MQIKVAKHSGFCFGVKRAINIVDRAVENSNCKNNIYSLGPVIHNPQVVERLSKKGLKVVKEVKSIKKGIVIIPSHGVPIEAIERLKKKNLSLIDVTCPFVKNAHRIVKDLKKKDYRVIIIGDKKHPEVKALLSLAGKTVKSKKVGIVSQTTQTKDNYLKGILDTLKQDNFNEAKVFNTICDDTSKRQRLTRDFLKKCDVMIVVGGKNSANTKRLYEICKVKGVTSFHIEEASELKKIFFIGKKCAGVVSGASTPDSMVTQVVDRVKALTK